MECKKELNEDYKLFKRGYYNEAISTEKLDIFKNPLTPEECFIKSKKVDLVSKDAPSKETRTLELKFK